MKRSSLPLAPQNIKNTTSPIFSTTFAAAKGAFTANSRSRMKRIIEQSRNAAIGIIFSRRTSISITPFCVTATLLLQVAL
jgi:hypothetical protein